MKLILILGLAALVQAEIDWSKVRPLDVNPKVVTDTYKGLRHPLSPRITGGDEATPHAFPHQAALFIPLRDGTAFCGGSLISPKYIMTAAHCVQDVTDPRGINVTLGAHNVRQNEPQQITIQSAGVRVHEDWNPLLLQNDIAIIELSQPVAVDEVTISVIQLPSLSQRNDNFYQKHTQISGWGKDSDASTTISPVLRHIRTTVGSNLLCSVYYLGQIADIHICTSGDLGKSTCNGDSGGPVILDEPGEPIVQIGIVSFGIALGCEAGWPSVHLRVTEYLDWIAQHTDVRLRD